MIRVSAIVAMLATSGCALVLDWDYRVAPASDAGTRDARAADAGTAPDAPADGGGGDAGCGRGRCGTRAVSIAAGGSHTCIADEIGRVWCWGDNTAGQCGLPPGSPATVHEPNLVVEMDAVFVAAGPLHTCALAGGYVFCWGENQSGELGIDTAGAPQPTPQMVKMVFPMTVAAGDSFTCIIRASSNVACIGVNSVGQLARETMDMMPHTTFENGPISAAGAIALGNDHGCAIRGDSNVVCWGANVAGQLGRGSSAPFEITVATVAGGRTYDAVGAGPYHSCAVTSEGQLWCWGSNDHGQLGIGSSSSRNVPVEVLDIGPVAAGPDVRPLGLGLGHTCAIGRVDRALWCWGDNRDGQLGLGDLSDRGAPVRLAGDVPMAAIAVDAGNAHTCAIDGDGAVWCWGDNGRGQLALPAGSPDRSAPLRIGLPE